MRKTFLFISLMLFALVLGASAQDPVKPSAVSGEISSISSEKITLKTPAGDFDAFLSDKTQYFKVPPENPTLKAAVAATFDGIGVGDKVLVTGIMAADKKSLPARSVYLMSKSDLAQRQQKERDDWRVRGTVGRVENFNPQTNVITVVTRSMGAERKVAVKTGGETQFFRYAPDSVEFSKALVSKLGDIEPNDEIRVLGNRNADGSEVDAEKVVTGALRQNSGTIKSIDLTKNEVVITDTTTKKDVAVVIFEGSIMRQFPAEMAQRLAAMQMMQGGGAGGGMRPPGQGAGQTGQGNTQPGMRPPGGGQGSGQTPGQTPGAGMGGGMRAGGGFDDSRLPAVKLADLKVGDAIGVLSTRNQDASRVRAIKLFSGVEPFIEMAKMAASRPSGGQGQGGGNSLSIPGLDGFGGN